MTLIVVAPAAGTPLLSVARDCERVGAGALVVPPGTPDDMLQAVRDYTSLALCDTPEVRTRAELSTVGTPPAVTVLLDGSDQPGDLPADLHTVAELLRTLPADSTPIFGTRGGSPTPVLLAALSGGAHVRVGTADTPDTGRDDAQLTAAASGLARLAGRPPTPAAGLLTTV